MVKKNIRLKNTIKDTKSYISDAKIAINSKHPNRVKKKGNVDKAIKKYFLSLAKPTHEEKLVDITITSLN